MFEYSFYSCYCYLCVCEVSRPRVNCANCDLNKNFGTECVNDRIEIHSYHCCTHSIDQCQCLFWFFFSCFGSNKCSLKFNWRNDANAIYFDVFTGYYFTFYDHQNQIHMKYSARIKYNQMFYDFFFWQLHVFIAANLTCV